MARPKDEGGRALPAAHVRLAYAPALEQAERLTDQFDDLELDAVRYAYDELTTANVRGAA